MRLTRFKAAAAVIALAGSLTACGNAGEETASDTDVDVKQDAAADFEDGTAMKELAESGKIRIGVKFDQPGLGFMGTGDDLPTGFDVEVAKILAGDLGIAPEDVQWVETISDNREPFLQSDKVDLVLATYSITDERKQVVGQTGPYMLTGQQLLVRSDSDVQSVDDLQGKEVCSAKGSTSLENVNKEGMKGLPSETYGSCVDDLLAGSVEAVSTDGSILLGYAAEHPDELKVVGDEFSEERIGVGYQKNSPEMCEWINETLTEAADSGAYTEAWDATLGESGEEAPDLPELDPCA